jgi:hypothetical protein
MKHGCSISNYTNVRRQASGDDIPIGLVGNLPDKVTARAEVKRLHLPIHRYAEHELVERPESIHPKADTTIKGFDRILRNHLLPK